jgi:hypothetical protein
MISDKFTIEDIHQIRYDSFEKRKNMTAKELIEDTKKGAKEGKRILAELKSKKKIEKVVL